jgi:hypothetical protein
MTTSLHDHARRDVHDWVMRAVVGHNLCPFARAALPGLDLIVGPSTLEGVLHTVAAHALSLAERSLDTPATTLVVVPEGFEDFGDFLDLVYTAEQLLADAGLEGVIQIATFHPDYLFEGLAPDDLANHTNRAPWPTLHLLREHDVSEAVQRHPDPGAIPERNMRHLRAMGGAAVAALSRRDDADR